MVLSRSDFSVAARFQLASCTAQAESSRYLMNSQQRPELGYAFALPRLIARSAGRKVRRAELSRWEAYGLGILVFGISCAFAARRVLPFVRPPAMRVLVLLFLPFAIWVAYLLLYFVNAQVVAPLRKLGLYSAPTNNPFQHIVIMSLITLLAVLLLQDESDWLKSLGIFWLLLLSLNLFSMLILKLRHES